MVKLNYNANDQNALNGIISTFCIMFCMVITVLGIKLKWFKHRMNFEQNPHPEIQNNSNISNGGGKFKNTSENRLSQTTMQGHGVFRKLQDDEIPIERPKTLPPIRIRNSTKEQLQLKPSKANNKNDSISIPKHPNEQIPVERNREIFKNMKFNTFPTDDDLIPKVHNQQKQPSKSRQDRSKSPKKNSSPIKDESHRKNQSPTRQHHRSKSPEKQRSKEQRLSEHDKNSIEKQNKKNTKTSKPLKLDIEAAKRNDNNVKSRQFEKQKEEKNVKFADNTPEQITERRPTGYIKPTDEEIHQIGYNDELKEISTRRPTGFVRPTKEEMEELENFDNIIDGIDQQYPGTLKEKNGKIVFKIEGLSDNEEEIRIIKTIPTPEPRKSLEKLLENKEEPINLMPLASLHSGEDNNTEIDSWSAVRQHRNITQEMAKHHQAIREAAQIKAAKRQLKNPLAYDLDVNLKSYNDSENDKQQKQRKNDSSVQHFALHETRLSNNSTEA